LGRDAERRDDRGDDRAAVAGRRAAASLYATAAHGQRRLRPPRRRGDGLNPHLNGVAITSGGIRPIRQDRLGQSRAGVEVADDGPDGAPAGSGSGAVGAAATCSTVAGRAVYRQNPASLTENSGFQPSYPSNRRNPRFRLSATYQSAPTAT